MIDLLHTVILLLVALHWILSPEIDAPSLNIPIVEDLIWSRDFLCQPPGAARSVHLARAMHTSLEEVRRVAVQTVGQRDNPLWCLARKHRITASNFGQVLHAVRTGR